MREIKFRAWDKNRKQMFDRPFLVAPNGQIFGEHFVLYEHLDVMQYTGLKDKNGKEIYEGDIVNGKNTHGYIECENVEIHANAGLLHAAPFRHSTEYEAGFYSEDCEVIGNIYEHHELINN